MYSTFASYSNIDNKWIEALSLAYNDEMDSTTFGVAAQAILHNPNSSADSVIDITGNQDALDVNAPALYADGKKGDGSTSYVNTQINPTGVAKYSFGVYFTEELTINASSEFYIGATVTSTQEGYLRRSVSNLRFEASNNSAEYTLSGTEKGMVGTYNDPTGNTMGIRINGSDVGTTDTAGNINIVGNDFYFMVRNNSGSPAGYTSKKTLGYYILEDATKAQSIIWENFFMNVAERIGVDVHNSDMDSNVATYFNEIVDDSAVELSAQEARAKNRMIQEFVNSGIWAESDVVQVYATIEQSDANLVHDLKYGTTWGGSVLNSINRDIEGVYGNLVDMSLGTGYNAISDAINVGLDDASYAVHVIQFPSANDTNLLGAVGGSARTWINWSTILKLRWRVHHNSYSDTPYTSSYNERKNKTFSIVRNNSTQESLYEGTTLLEQVTKSSVNFAAGDVHICSEGGTNKFSDGKVSSCVIGSSTVIDSYKSILETINQNYLLRLKGFEIPLAT